MSNAVGVNAAAFYEVPKKGIGLVGGFRAVPMQRLARIVLKIAHVTNPGHFHQGIGKVVYYTGGHR